jgi:Xaa-Pro dipeptidase
MEERELKRELSFSMSEYESRVAKVKEEMDKRGLEVLMVFKPENYYWLTGFTGAYYAYVCLIFSKKKDPIFILPLLEERNAKVLSWVEHTEPWSVFAEPPKNDPVAHTARVLRNEGLDKGTIGIELNAWWQTPLMYEQLRQHLAETKFVESTSLIDNFRAIKSEAELECLRMAGRILTKAMYAGINAVGEDRTENDVVAAIWQVLLSDGSEPMSGMPLISSAYRTALTHNSWCNRRLNRGDPVFIEFGAAVKRYHATMMRTVAVKEPSKEFREMFDVTCEALNRGIEAVKPGVTSGEVDDVVRGTIRKLGYGDYFLHRSAYSIGIGFAPSWLAAPFIKEKDPTVLQPGMVFHMVPVVFRYGMGIGLSEPIAVTNTGCEILANVERKLFIK